MNGFIKVLEEIGAAHQKDLDAAAKLREQLKEATALLEMVKDCCADEPRERVRAFLSRTAPQLEPTQASSEAGAKYFDWDRAPAQVAAPTPECRYGESFCGDTGCPTHGIEQPAAPTADMPEDQRTLIDSYMGQPAAPTACLYDVFMSGVRKPAAPEPSADFSAYPMPTNARERWLVEKAIEEHTRAESAEAQLAAVRTIATDMVAQLQKVGYLPAKTRVMRHEGFIEALMRGFVDIAALLTTPSPGEGEETLARPDPDLMRHHHDQCGAWHGHSCDCHITPAAAPGRSGK